MAKAPQKKSNRKKEKRVIPHGVVSIFSSFNNTIISLTDPQGKVFAWSSTGKHKFKGSRKSTPFAAKIVGEDVVEQAALFGMKSCDIRVKGPGSGRESALRAVAASGIKINSITDVTPVPHNGCRPPKRRRI